jgi:hypothetical protein
MNGATFIPFVACGGIPAAIASSCPSPISMNGRNRSTICLTSMRATTSPAGRPVAIAAATEPDFTSGDSETRT